MKNILLSFLLTMFLGSMISIPVYGSIPPKVSATSAILMDYTTGQVLFQRNASLRRYPASTTKILTSLVAVEHSDLKKIITASYHASHEEGSSIYLASGEKHTLKELLYGMLLSSGNDAAVAVSEGLAGSESKYAEWMTEKAYEIGAKDSHFANSNGLPDKDHYTTAYDLALITRAALHNPIIDKIVKTKQIQMSWPGHSTEQLLVNHNKMLWLYPNADGVKTGYTIEAGQCLVSSATKNGHRLIVVVLNSKRTYQDSIQLFNYGFANYQLMTVASPKTEIGDVQVIQGVENQVAAIPNRLYQIVIPQNELSQLQLMVKLQPSVKAPVERMQPVGELDIKLDNKVIQRISLVTANNVQKKVLFQRIFEWLKALVTFAIK